MMKAVRIAKYGGLDVLQVLDIPRPQPSAGEVLVKVKATGINPGEASIREGYLEHLFHTDFPSGEGSDLAGIVEEVGDGVDNFAVGDEVIGFSHTRGAHAEYAIVPAKDLVPRPANVSWEQGGALFVAGTTAWACIKAVDLQAGDTVVVSGAAGGVGSIAVQLARQAGATVIGLAGEANHAWLSQHGVIPVRYGDGQEDRIREASKGKVDAFIDTFGKGYVELALKLGVSPDRINTIIDFEAVAKHGIKAEGSQKAATAEVLTQLTTLMAEGKLELVIAKTFPLAEVQEAFRELEQRHTHGKIVLIP
jgi:NADPH:quinone reductase-like Zn-dependent oxidoreductase